MTPAAPRFALIQADMAVPRLALSRAEAAASLGMSLDSFERYVQPELRLIRRGSLRVVPVRELERWLEANAERVFGDAA
jgi:hypothetical protein